jgi:hypothetical protein
MATKKSSGRKYGPAASKSVEREMKAFKKGKLKSGSGRKVTNSKQAIAIGLSEARKGGAKMPLPPAKSAAAKKSSAKKSAAKKSAAKKSAAQKLSKTATKKAPAKKTAVKKSASKKTSTKTIAKKAVSRKSGSKK